MATTTTKPRKNVSLGSKRHLSSGSDNDFDGFAETEMGSAKLQKKEAEIARKETSLSDEESSTGFCELYLIYIIF